MMNRLSSLGAPTFLLIAMAAWPLAACGDDASTDTSSSTEGAGASSGVAQGGAGASASGGGGAGGSASGGSASGGSASGGMASGGSASGGMGGAGGAMTTCGDGVVEGSEACDDNNTTPLDGCDANCAEEAGWNCDGADPTVCVEICGDGLVVGGEGCDDGGTSAYDGCSPTCTTDTGWDCVDSGGPSTCTPTCGDGVRIDAGSLCASCGAVACATEDTACTGDAECAKFTSCTDGCATGACIEGCATSFPSAATTALQACLTANCSVACAPTSPRESCDDMNTTATDGCSDTCRVELYSRCIGEGVGSCNPINILYAPAQADGPVLRAAVAAITGGAVDYFDANATTPVLNDFANYDCVHTYADRSFADEVAMGDVLAAYADTGLPVSLGVFSTFTTGNFLGGTIMTAGYAPVTSATGDNHFVSSTYANDGTTILHDSVTTYECQYRDELQLQGAGIQDGSYADGEIAAAHRPDFGVTYTNGSGHDSLGCTGDWARLTANACAARFAR